MRVVVVLAGALGLLLACSASAGAATDCSYVRDNFDRSDSPTLGPNWTEQASDLGDIGIESAHATNPAITEGLATFNGLAGTFTGLPNDAACVDVATNGSTSVQYVAIVLDYADRFNSIFVKVQVNSGTQFNHVYFYVGNDGAPFAPHLPLTPFASGRITVSRAGDDVTLDVDSNFDGAPDQTITASGANAIPGLGHGFGLGVYGHPAADNFATARPTNAFTIGQITRNKRNGTATVQVVIPGPGTLALGGNGVKTGGATVSRAVKASQPVDLVVRATGKKKRKLKSNGKVRVAPAITYTPVGGSSGTQTASIKLKKKL
jgi:hypothetical protein